MTAWTLGRFAAVVALLSVRSAAADVIYVTAEPPEQATGATIDDAIAITAALNRAQPGDELRLLPGRYAPVVVNELSGEQDRPIRIVGWRPHPDDAAVVIAGPTQQHGRGLTLIRCHHLVVEGLEITGSQKGVSIQSCSVCRVSKLNVHDLGQEAIHVGRGETNTSGDGFSGPASQDIVVSGNRIAGTGQVTAIYGEGIYIGTGAIAGDDTHDVLIENNELTDISAEAIELKPGTYNLTVRGNRITNTHHQYNAAITICVEGTTGRSGRYLIENNVIDGVHKVRYSVAGIAIGHGDAIIRNNEICNVDGGVGIQVYHRFQNPAACRVVLSGNDIQTNGPGDAITLHHGNCGREDTDLLADVVQK